jgi:hypothetical protein
MIATGNFRWLILIVLGAVSAGRLFLEHRLTSELREEQLLPVKLETKLRDEMSQEAFAAALGGMRSLLAVYYELEAFSAFTKQPPEWHTVDKYYSLGTKLQPLDPYYWEMHSWMMGTNAAESYAVDGEAPKGLEREMRRQYRERGLEILNRGLQFLPNNYKLHRRIADMYAFANKEVNPTPDHAKAAESYLKASQCEGALPFLYRFHVYQVAMVPGREVEAYQKLRDLYWKGGNNRAATLINLVKKFEQRFNVPLMLRIPEDGKEPPTRWSAINPFRFPKPRPDDNTPK